MSAPAPTSTSPLVILLVINGLSSSELTSTLEKLKTSTKSMSTHARRQFFFLCYTQIIRSLSKSTGGSTSKLYGLARFYASEGDVDSGELIYDEFDERIKKLTNPSKQTMQLLGSLKIKVVDDEGDSGGGGSGGQEYMMPFFDEDASRAFEDITRGEECITLSISNGIQIQTAFKKRLAKGSVPTQATKTAQGLQEFINTLTPNEPLVAVNWFGGNEPPSVNSYNVVLIGPWPSVVVDKLPPQISNMDTTSQDEIYRFFEKKRNEKWVNDACILIDKHLTDVARNETKHVVYTSSMQDAGKALRYNLIKTVYVDSKKGKFIDNIKSTDGIELFVIECVASGGKSAGMTRFEEFGGVVFECFYRVDLSLY